MLATVLMLGFVLVTAYTDARWRRIYNWTTYPGILTALALGGLVSLCGEWKPCQFWLGQVDFGDSLWGLLVCGGSMLICFVFFPIGGGDVKLIAMLGAFLGLQFGIKAMLWTLVFGAAVGVIALIWKIGTLKVLRRFIQYVAAVVRMRGFRHLQGSLDAELETSLYLAPSAVAAVVLVLLEREGIITGLL